jgi:hypothetical protein
MATEIAQLKRRMKFGPKMGRELRAEFLLTQVKGPPRRLSPATLEKIRAEVERLALSTNPRVQEFVSVMAARYPELGS